MPQIYWMEPIINTGEVWLFTEYLEPLRGQIKLTPKHLDQIIPTVAKFHALKFEDRFLRYADVFDSWLPHYDSKLIVLERTQHIEKTDRYLEKTVLWGKELGLY